MATAQGLPRDSFAKLSPHPYLLTTLRGQGPSPTPSRVNRRAPDQARALNVNASTLTHAHGSALVRLGDNTVVCGVRGEILHTASIPNFRGETSETSGASETSTSTSSSELRDYDLLVPNIELSTGSAPQFLPGTPPTTLAQTLSTRVFSLLHSSNLVDVEDLRIWHTLPAEEMDSLNKKSASDGEDEGMADGDDDGNAKDAQAGTGEKAVVAYWVLYIDIFFVSFDGNPFDVAWAAMVAALRNTELPAARWDPDREIVVCSRAPERRKPLRLSGFPVACSAAVFAGGRGREKESLLSGPPGGEFYTLVDPDRFEEGLCEETLTVVVDCGGDNGNGQGKRGETKILAISKHGGTALQPELVREFIGVAERRWDEFRKVIMTG